MTSGVDSLVRRGWLWDGVHNCRCTAVRRVLFFLNYPATTVIYTLSLHDALPICTGSYFGTEKVLGSENLILQSENFTTTWAPLDRSEEHTPELQSHSELVCRLLLENKK